MTDVLTRTHGQLGLITLDRPQALNALNEAMCVAIHTALNGFALDPAVRAVAIEGAGERAFCAGGDVVQMHADGRAGSPGWERFFATEYRMNAAIARFPKPYIALMDGVTMGGGVGVSIHGSHRVATERTIWAMPETGIGMVTDVGSTYPLAHLPGSLGTFLGLTGARLDGAEALGCGIATHYVPGAGLEVVKAALADGADPDAALAAASIQPPPARLVANRATIDRLFAGETVEAIVAALRTDGGEWATKEAATLATKSPIALKLVFELLRRGVAATDVGEALANEYRVVCALKSGHDFYEGVRAQLIDKDRAPKWRPATLAEVSGADVQGYFAEPPDSDLALS